MIYETTSEYFLDFTCYEWKWPRHFSLSVKTGRRLHRKRVFNAAFGLSSGVTGLQSAFDAVFSGGRNPPFRQLVRQMDALTRFILWLAVLHGGRWRRRGLAGSSD